MPRPSLLYTVGLNILLCCSVLSSNIGVIHSDMFELAVKSQEEMELSFM